MPSPQIDPRVTDFRSVKCVAIIRKNETGEVRECATTETVEEGHKNPSDFNWSENNYSCDCNRDLLWGWRDGFTVDDVKCSHGRFAVNLKNLETGEIYYREFEP